MIPHLSESWLKSDLVDSSRKVWPSCRCKKLLECLLPLHKQPVTGVFGENAEAQKENTNGSATLTSTAPMMQICFTPLLHSYKQVTTLLNQPQSDGSATLKSSNDVDVLHSTATQLQSSHKINSKNTQKHRSNDADMTSLLSLLQN